MSEEAKIRKDLERALGPLQNSVWEELIEDEYIRMYLEGNLEVDDPEASWDFLKAQAQKQKQRAERHVSEALGQSALTEGETFSKERGRWRWVPYKASLDKPENGSEEIESFLDYFLFIGPE